jgi:hypothetical protein
MAELHLFSFRFNENSMRNGIHQTQLARGGAMDGFLGNLFNFAIFSTQRILFD